MFSFEAAVRNVLTNPAFTSSVNQWLPFHLKVAHVKVKNLNFSTEDFGERGKMKRPLVSTPKKKFNPMVHNNRRLLTLTDIGKAFDAVAPQRIVFTALPKPKIKFVREILTKNIPKPADVASIDDIILMSQIIKSFKENLSKNMTVENIKLIESKQYTWSKF